MVWLASLAAATPLSAQPALPSGATLSQAIEAAWARSPDNPAVGGRLRRAEAERQSATAPWAGPPVLELESRRGRVEPAGTLREQAVGVAWPLWLPGQRPAREAAAAAEVAASQQGIRAARLKVAADVREAQVAFLEQEARLREADAGRALLAALADDVDRRVGAGDLARVDALAARAELLSAANTLSQGRQRLREAQARWTALTGVASVPPPEQWTPPPQAADEHPEVALASANLAAARRRLDAVERSRRDPPEVGIQLRRESASPGPGGENSVAVTLRIPFATDSRNQPLLAAALAVLEEAQVQEQRVRERLVLDGEAARSALAAADEQLQAERSRAALLRERATLLERSFRAGETPLPESLRSLALAAQAEAAVLRQQSEQLRAQARLDHLMGRMP